MKLAGFKKEIPDMSGTHSSPDPVDTPSKRRSSPPDPVLIADTMDCEEIIAKRPLVGVKKIQLLPLSAAASRKSQNKRVQPSGLPHSGETMQDKSFHHG
jgi:hypothetical protein